MIPAPIARQMEIAVQESQNYSNDHPVYSPSALWPSNSSNELVSESEDIPQSQQEAIERIEALKFMIKGLKDDLDAANLRIQEKDRVIRNLAASFVATSQTLEQQAANCQKTKSWEIISSISKIGALFISAFSVAATTLYVGLETFRYMRV